MVLFTIVAGEVFPEEGGQMLKTHNAPTVRAIAVVVALLCLTLGAAQPARADLVDGELGFFGTFLATGGSNPVSGGMSLQDATGINFTMGLVTQATGDFSGLAFWPVSLTDFTFAPFSPVTSLWSVGGFQFGLEDLTSVSQGANHLALAGTGAVTSSGFDATPFNWSFSGNNSGGTLQLFSSTATPGPVSVAEPSEFSSLALLVIGLSTLGIWSRRRWLAQL